MNKRTRPYRKVYRIPGTYSQIAILRHPDKTLWETTKEFINRLRVDEKFKRKELLKYIYKINMSSFENTVDHYRLWLTHIKVIDHISCGLYVKRKQIPKSLTTTKLKKLAYNQNWESWFTPHELLNELIE